MLWRSMKFNQYHMGLELSFEAWRVTQWVHNYDCPFPKIHPYQQLSMEEQDPLSPTYDQLESCACSL